MKRYFLRRLLLLLPTLAGTLTLVFFLIHFIPGDPVEVMLGETASPGDKEELRKSLGLDQPLIAQYRAFLMGVTKGDLGQSLSEQTPVIELIRARIPATLELTVSAMAVAIFLSFILGMLGAIKKDSLIDRMGLLFSLFGLSMPNFWLGPLLIIVFAIQFGWLPVSGRGGFSHLLLPSVTLGLGMAAILTRIFRIGLIQTIREDYIQTARAKGLTERQVWLKHTLRNALLSVITILSLQFGSLLAGAVITETIFSWPGIGRLTVQAIQMRDYPLVQGCVLAIAFCYLLVNFLSDILYGLVDPRISYEK